MGCGQDADVAPLPPGASDVQPPRVSPDGPLRPHLQGPGLAWGSRAGTVTQDTQPLHEPGPPVCPDGGLLGPACREQGGFLHGPDVPQLWLMVTRA